MGKIHLSHLMLFCLSMFVPCLCQQDDLDNVTTSVYVVTLKQAPTSHYYYGELTSLNESGFKHNASGTEKTQFQKPRYHFF